MSSLWKPEIEKRYRLSGPADAGIVAKRAELSGLHTKGLMLQKDWIPDFAGFLMRDHNILLRIRTEAYLKGTDVNWVVTIKQKAVLDGVHHNKELEASLNNQSAIPEMSALIHDTFGVQVDIVKLAQADAAYARKVGLTEHRIYLEKKRRDFVDDDDEVVLAIDELPYPAGWFAELELNDASKFSSWEKRLYLHNAQVELRDYGEIAKDITKLLSADKQRRLSF